MSGYGSTRLLGTARVATTSSYFLGEGPIWDPVRERILWVDMLAGTVYSGRIANGGGIEVEERIDFPDTAGAVAVSREGELVVAGTHRLFFRAVDGSVTSGPQLIAGAGRRFNDGKPDPVGRMVVGTIGSGRQSVLRVEPDGTLTALDEDVEFSNGLAWSSDGRRLFTVDTLMRRIFVRDYDAATGQVGDRTLFAELEHGYPDGITIDSHEHLWVAVWGEGCVLRLDPTGRVVARVDVPAPHATCPVFAGPGLDTLVITTAIEDLSDEQLHQHPLSGRLFTIKPGITGIDPYLWSGRHHQLLRREPT